MEALAENRVECVRELVAVEGVDLETRDSRGVGLEENARDNGSLEAWQVVREELGRREEQRREERTRTLSVDMGNGCLFGDLTRSTDKFEIKVINKPTFK